jgi:cyclophilin family peptidyl-prolyl cis-trans isomerase
MKALLLSTLLLLAFSCDDKNPITPSKAKEKESSSTSKARIKTVHGDIVFYFYKKDAPNTTARIKELISSGFYNGLTFHRVIPGFVVQGGDPKGNGTGGSGKNIVAEFNKNKHVLGTVAMARSSDPNSADSQFYISLGTHPHLDNKYTVFGFVGEGLEVANKIQKGDKMISVTLE